MIDFELLFSGINIKIGSMVLQGAAITKSDHQISTSGSHKLKIWMVDPGVVLDKIVIGDYKPSRLGPPETRVISNPN